jgi:SAM-dependent methyltransferase
VNGDDLDEAGGPVAADGPDEVLFARMRWNVPLSLAHAGLLMDRLDLRPGLRIADLGCGWGELLLQVVARAVTGDGGGPAGGNGTSGARDRPGGSSTAAEADGPARGTQTAGEASTAREADSPARGTQTAGEASTAREADNPAAGTTGIGVDTDVALLGRARRLARQRGLDRYVRFSKGDVTGWPETADRVLCTGAAHAFGGTERALAALAGTVPPGGRLLYGDGYWEQPPTAAATGIFGDDLLSLPALLEACRATGWRVIHLSTADQREWDDFESTFRAGRQEWLIGHAGHPRAAEIRDWLDARERQYAEVYRQVLGFAYLVLAH